MSRKMRAAQYDKESGVISIGSIAVPEPAQDQLLIRIVAASLCHSDLMMSQRPDNRGPLTIGHEAVGVVSKMHPSAEGKGFRVGDRVGMLGIVDSCFHCEGCRVHPTFCGDRSRGGAKIQGLQADGLFAEYAVADRANTIHLPEGLPIEKMSPLFCAGITAFHAVDKCDLKPGQWLAIVGCGGVGQLALRYAKAMDLRVICLDLNDDMLDLARQKGADATFNPLSSTAFTKEIRKLTGSRGCHAAAVFSDANAAYATAQRVLQFNGLLMTVGMPDRPLELLATAVSLNLIRVKGASNGRADEMKKAVDFTQKHQIIPEVIFRELDEMPQMWAELASGKAKGKMVVLFEDSKSRL